MTKNDTEIARHDERLKAIEAIQAATDAKLDSVLEVVNAQNLNILKYKNSNAMWALTLAAMQTAITTVAAVVTVIFTGKAPVLADAIASLWHQFFSLS